MSIHNLTYLPDNEKEMIENNPIVSSKWIHKHQILTWGCRQTTTEVAQRSGQVLPDFVSYDHTHWNIEPNYAHRTVEAIQSPTINLKIFLNIGKC